MLTLSYLFSCSADSNSPPPVDIPAGAIAFGGDGGHANLITVATPVLAPVREGTALLEIWRAAGPVTAGRRGALQFWHNGQLLFGSIELAETAEPSELSPGPAPTALHAATAAAYRQIFALLDDCAFPHLWRVWNFIPRINAADDELERYRQFNIARQAAFVAAGRALEGNVPAASAVGSVSGGLAIYFFAGRTAPLPIENPRQLSAYRYPTEYGPRSPLFARAGLVRQQDGELLFISGTASIVGHRSLHLGDVIAQTRESLANIDAILDAANAQAAPRRFARGDLVYKIYVRRPADLAPVRTAFEAWLGAAGAAIYLQADICRTELLVEIEASGGHRSEVPRA